MFVRSRGVWFGFAEKLYTFCSAKSRKHVFSEDDCHPSLNLHSFTNIGWSLRLLEKTWKAVVFVSNKFVFLCNLSCYCKRNFAALVGLFGDNRISFRY